jgi:hypothetical protein
VWAGLLLEPGHGGPGGAENGDVPVAGAQPVLRRGGIPRQRLSVRSGHDAVLATVQVQDWGAYQPRTETPGSDIGQVVVDRPPGPPLRSAAVNNGSGGARMLGVP